MAINIFHTKLEVHEIFVNKCISNAALFHIDFIDKNRLLALISHTNDHSHITTIKSIIYKRKDTIEKVHLFIIDIYYIRPYYTK